MPARRALPAGAESAGIAIFDFPDCRTGQKKYWGCLATQSPALVTAAEETHAQPREETARFLLWKSSRGCSPVPWIEAGDSG